MTDISDNASLVLSDPNIACHAIRSMSEIAQGNVIVTCKLFDTLRDMTYETDCLLGRQ